MICKALSPIESQKGWAEKRGGAMLSTEHTLSWSLFGKEKLAKGSRGNSHGKLYPGRERRKSGNEARSNQTTATCHQRLLKHQIKWWLRISHLICNHTNCWWLWNEQFQWSGSSGKSPNGESTREDEERNWKQPVLIPCWGVLLSRKIEKWSIDEKVLCD